MTRLIDRIALHGVARAPARDFLGPRNMADIGNLYREVRQRIDFTLPDEELRHRIESDDEAHMVIGESYDAITMEQVRKFAARVDQLDGQSPATVTLTMAPSVAVQPREFHWQAQLANVTTVVADNIWQCVDGILGKVEIDRDLGCILPRWDNGFVEFYVGGDFHGLECRSIGIALTYATGEQAAEAFRRAGGNESADELEGAPLVVRGTPYFETTKGRIIGPGVEVIHALTKGGAIDISRRPVMNTCFHDSLSASAKSYVADLSDEAIMVALYTTTLAHTRQAKEATIKPLPGVPQERHRKRTGKAFETYRVLKIDSIDRAAEHVRTARRNGEPIRLHHVSGGKWDYTDGPGMFGNPKLRRVVSHAPTFRGNPEAGVAAKHYEIAAPEDIGRSIAS